MRSDATFFVFANLGAFEYHGTPESAGSLPARSIEKP